MKRQQAVKTFDKMLDTPITLKAFKEKCPVEIYGYYAEEDELQYTFFAIPNSAYEAVYEMLKKNDLLELAFKGMKIEYALYRNQKLFVNYTRQEIEQEAFKQ